MNRPSTSSMAQERDRGFMSAGLKLTALDLLTGDVIWTLEPTLESAQRISAGSADCLAECDAVSLARLVTVHSTPLGAEVMLLLSVRSGATYAWHVDASNGKIALGSGHTSTSQEASKGPLVGVMSLGRSAEHHRGTAQYLLVMQPCN